MSIIDYTEYLMRVNNPNHRTVLSKSGLATVTGRMHSLWTAAPLAGASPSVPIAPNNLTVGALPFIGSLGVQRIAQVEATSSVRNTVVICDRLSHQGSLFGTVIGEQFTNLPTAVLTRYTDGMGVMAALEIYVAVGATPTTATVTYTNHLGISGRVAPLTVFGSADFNASTRFIILPLADGDRGTRSVENVILSASTGTAGNFGVTLFKPLFAFPIPMSGPQMVFDSMLGMCGNAPQVFNNACLFAIVVSSTIALGEIDAVINIIEE